MATQKRKGRAVGRGPSRTGSKAKAAPVPEGPPMAVRYRDAATGRFTKRKKGQGSPAQARKNYGIVQELSHGRRYRDTKTGRFAARPKGGPVKVVTIGKGKRRKTLQPATEVEPVRPIKADEFDALPATAKDLARMAEDNAERGRGTYIKQGGVYSRLRPENAGSFAQLVRLINADYLSIMGRVLDSPWLRFDLNEFQDRDLMDFDAHNLNLAESPLSAKGRERGLDVDVQAAKFLSLMGQRFADYLDRPPTKPAKKKAATRKPAKEQAATRYRDAKTGRFAVKPKPAKRKRK